MAASWLHLLRVSPALHPPERPSHTHTPKPGFGGKGHEVACPYKNERRFDGFERVLRINTTITTYVLCVTMCVCIY